MREEWTEHRARMHARTYIYTHTYTRTHLVDEVVRAHGKGLLLRHRILRRHYVVQRLDVLQVHERIVPERGRLEVNLARQRVRGLDQARRRLVPKLEAPQARHE